MATVTTNIESTQSGFYRDLRRQFLELAESIAGKKREPLPDESGVMLITPQIALDWLKRNPHNRRIRFEKVQRWMGEMTAGRWVVNGQSISFKKNGDLNDGQHRLWACALAKRNFSSWVVLDVDNKAFATVDTGLRRSAADVLHIGDIKYESWVASAARLALIYASTPRKRMNEPWTERGIANNVEVYQYAMDHPELSKLAEQFQKMKLKERLAPGLTLFCWAEMRAMSAKKADEFMDALATGVGLDRGHPVLTLREELTREYKRLAQHEISARIIKAWNSYYYGKKLSRFLFRENGWAPNFGDEDDLREDLPETPPPAKVGLRKATRSVVVEETIAE